MIVDVLLATYNGEQFIENQILSILMQTNDEWRLLVHDDGSTDKTLEIIKKFESVDSRIILIDDGITGLGPAGNFMHLLKYATSDFICFCDQDDIWLENKIQKQLEAILRKDNSKPQVVFCNKYIWEKGEIRKYPLRKYYRFSEILFQNGGAQGCCAIFNKELLTRMQKEYDFAAMHDHLLTLCAIMENGINYQNDRLILYRRHANNVTQIKRSFLERMKKKSPLIEPKYYRGIKAFYKTNSEYIDQKQKREIYDYLYFPKANKLYQLTSILKHGYSIYKSKTRFLLKWVIH